MLEAIVPLISLIAPEVILGIDGIIFISIIADRLPKRFDFQIPKEDISFSGIFPFSVDIVQMKTVKKHA